MKVTFLGTNGWFDTPAGNTVSVLLQSENYDILFDAGNGIAKADRYITQDRPSFLFLSHMHIDHIAGLHTLCKFRFRQGLTVFTKQGTREQLETFVNDPYTVPFSILPFKNEVRELSPGTHNVPFTVTCLPLVHPAPCFGYRVELDGRVIAYCTDTGVCDNAVTLARNADLLITECGLKPGESSPDWPHLNPQDAIGIAKKAHAKRLALVHFGAEVYKTVEERKAVQDEFERLCPGLIAATDGMQVEV
ncbi:MBL fold metallo-hydrolase [Methanoregula sp.]|uniref:MBL fold metallo-hydrolase n=1 Tax=Methanoregula sp. TaxID=2052170 RepID=UPI000CC4606C|nr:ribonuclease Z [Methanoregula sp.]PKG33870.1 MAG: MBL fold metallo-hydrolase [Methanoregula sp.]